MSLSDVKRSSEPEDKLSRIGSLMVDAGVSHPEYDDETKLICFLDDGEQGCITMQGYDDEAEVIRDLLVHLEAMLKLNGQNLLVVATKIGRG